jgi:hypothetical protein
VLKLTDFPDGDVRKAAVSALAQVPSMGDRDFGLFISFFDPWRPRHNLGVQI